MEVNCYILAQDTNSKAIIIDPGDEEEKIRQVLDKYKLKPAFVINTHGHYDHIGCDDKFDVPIYIHSKELPLLKEPQLNLSGLFAIPYQVKSEVKTLNEEDIVKLDDIELKILHLPGHTPGGIALLMQKPTDKIVFTGDSLFFQGIGRSDLDYGDESLLIKSIKEKLFKLADDTVVYPGHGPTTTIGMEKKNNPF
jgi:glyoxylase-like metal-dependent hydrolase (beta-lactamase superfamily II)